MSISPPLTIPRTIHDAMLDHCRRDAPLEACGELGGRGSAVLAFHPLRNAAASETRYSVDPLELVELARTLRDARTEIVAIYHSHPRWSARPSKVDLAENYHEGTPRIIVSLLTEPPEVRIWRFEGDSYSELAWELV
jgi:proteasome lid subunit RPN8/RPN11